MQDSLDAVTRANTHALIVAKRDAIVAERVIVLEQRAELLTRLRRLDRELSDCRAAARLFGLEIEFPSDERDNHAGSRDLQQYFQSFADAEREKFPTPPPPPPHPASIHPPKHERPTVRELVLGRLRVGGATGEKAASIRDYIERTYGEPLHSKTVGMTLYRLLQSGDVRREGQTWFLSPPKAEGENPGVAAPGPIDPRT
jgi:hypothetical protein